MSATMRDIARIVGVSVNTVSRALNDRPEISQETKEKIRKIARELNYTPNTLAQALVKGDSKTIGLIVSDNANPFFAQQIRGIEEIARLNGYSVLLSNTCENSSLEVQAIYTLRMKQVDGILITPVQADKMDIRQLKDDQFPFVLLNRHSNDAQIDSVRNDNLEGAYQATRHLIQLGHTQILHITGPERVSSVRERIAGYKKALNEENIPFQSNLLLRTNLSLEDGYHKTRAVFTQHLIKPTAIFAYSDFLAIGVLKALNELKVDVPKDIALVGYDDIEIAEFIQPPLTTVAQDANEIGRRGTKILLEKINKKGGDWVPQQIIITPKLKIRVSSGFQIS